MKIRVENIELHAEQSGSGSPTLIFLHYWGGSTRTWCEVTARLAGSFRCVAYDHRGWGESDAFAGDCSLARLANDAEAVISELIAGDYILVGHSMGGKVAQLLASRNPAGLKGMVLVAPAPPVPQQIPEEAHQMQIHAYDNRSTVEGVIAFLTASGLPAELHEQVVEDSLRGSAAAKYFWPNVGAYEDISADVSRIAVPTLVIAGEHDRQDPVEQHRNEMVARIPGSALKVVPGAGHLLPIEAPEEVAAAIARFAANIRQVAA